MTDAEILKNARNTLLKLHKGLVDSEREIHEGIHGPLTAGQFLNVLIEDPGFSWLRKFSMLIVEIDEMFDLKDGQSAEMITASLDKVKELAEMREEDEDFKARYTYVLQTNPEAAANHAELKKALAEGR